MTNPALFAADVVGAFTTWPSRDFASDGFDHDDQGNVLLTDLAHNAVRAGEQRRVRRVVADAGYWSIDNVALRGVESFIARAVPGS